MCGFGFFWFVFVFVFLPPHSIWSSWARDQIQVTVVVHTTAVAGMLDPLTHCAGPGIEPASWHCRDATDPRVPQWELQFFLVLILTLRSLMKVPGFLTIIFRGTTVLSGKSCVTSDNSHDSVTFIFQFVFS